MPFFAQFTYTPQEFRRVALESVDSLLIIGLMVPALLLGFFGLSRLDPDEKLLTVQEMVQMFWILLVICAGLMALCLVMWLVIRKKAYRLLHAQQTVWTEDGLLHYKSGTQDSPEDVRYVCGIHRDLWFYRVDVCEQNGGKVTMMVRIPLRTVPETEMREFARDLNIPYRVSRRAKRQESKQSAQ